MLVHPDPQRRIPSARLKARFDEAIAGLPARIDLDGLFLILARITASLGDSHTTVAPPDVGSELWLPLRIEGNAVFLRREVGSLPSGSRISRFDGRPAEALLDIIRPLTGAETGAAIDAALPRLIPFALRQAGAATGEVVLDAVTPQGDRVRATVAHHHLDELAEEDAVEGVVLPGGTLYLRVRTMAGQLDEYQRYFREMFAWVDESATRGLIIDLRENSGGSTMVGELLLRHITTRPYRMFGKKRWRVSSLMQEQLRGMGEWSKQYLAASPGTYLEEEPPLKPPPEVEHRFDGPRVVLIGPRTRSAAMMMANATRDFDLALVLGMPTSSPPNYFGESYRYELPNSGLRVSISSAEFVRANGDASDGDPVLPHLEIPTDEPIGSSRDETLAAALYVIDRHFAATRGRGARADASPTKPGSSPSPRGLSK